MSINKKEDISYLVGILLIISDVSASYKTGTVECDKLIINQIIRTYIISGRGNFNALERNYDELLKRVNNYIYTQLQREIIMPKESDMQSFRAIYNYLIKNYLHIVNLAKWDDTMSSSSNSLSAKELKIAKLLKQQRQQGGKKSKKQPKKEILGKIICIHKIPNDRKEYVKHKGKLITIKKYKELIKVKSEK
jgi:hypothetical protein